MVAGKGEQMTSFSNIAKIRRLLYRTLGDDKLATSMLRPGGRHQSIVDAVAEACPMGGINMNADLLHTVIDGMADYLRGYPSPASYKQHLWDSCDSWIRRIAEVLGLDAGDLFEDELPRPVERDLGIELIKALHAKGGKTKAELERELGVGKKTIQTELRALDPSLQKTGEKVRPLRIAGQEMHPKIEYRDQYQEDNAHRYDRVFYMEERLHPLALQLNTHQVGTLLLALYRRYEDEESNLSYEMALDVWCQLSPYGQERIKEIFGREPGFREFLEQIRAELAEGRLLAFHSEDELIDSLSHGELLMGLYKGAVECRIKIRQNGKTIELDKARIVSNGGNHNAWLAIPWSEYPDETNAVSFTTEELVNAQPLRSLEE